MAEPLAADSVEIRPVGSEQWADVEKLFGGGGSCSSCWCTYWWHSGGGGHHSDEDNKRELRGLVDDGAVPGLLAYVDGEPAAWLALGPRERYRRLENSRNLKRIDDAPVWSIVCLFVSRSYRRRGMMGLLLNGAIEYAMKGGAPILEGYPVDPEQKLSGSNGYTGIVSAYRDAGFVEVKRPSASQVIMRYVMYNS